MKKILILLIVFGFALTVYSKDLKFQDFYNGGLTAFKDGDVKLATYFFEEAEKMARADSVFKGYVWNVRFRDANYLIGKYEQAKEFGEKCIAISKAGLGENNPGLHYDYKLLAFICAENKDYDSARCYIDSIDMVLPPRSNEREFQYDKAISKGVIYSKMKDWSTAESYLEPARMRSQRFPLSDDSRKSLNLLGEACFQNNDYDSALYAFMDLRRINERNFGRNSREYQRANYQVGKMLMYIGDYMESEWIFKEVLDWYQERLPQQLKTLQASDRIDYIEDLNEIMPNIVLFGFAAGHYDDYFTSLVYDQLFLPRYALRAPEKYSEAVIKEMGMNKM